MDGTKTAIATRSLHTLPGPRGLPLLGNLHQLELDRFHLGLEAWAARYGDLFTFRLAHKRCLGVGDAELVRHAFQERPEGFRRVRAMESVARELGVHGVFTAEGEDWRRQRKLMMPAFRESNLSAVFPTLQRITERLLVILQRAAEQRERLDVLPLLMRYTVDVTAAVAFGQDIDSLQRGHDELQSQLELIFGSLLRRINAPVPYWRYVQLPRDRALARALVKTRQHVDALIAEARSAVSERAAAPRTLLESMVVATDETGPAARLSHDELVGNVLTLLLAGEDTTANTLAWLLYYMATEPDVAAELRSEADSVLDGGAVLAASADAQRLPYLTAVVNEALRLRSPAPFIYLEPNSDSVLGDVRLPAGTPVFLLTRHVATRDHHFRDPQRFDPRRWLDRDDEQQRSAAARAYAPFGAGPRICPGRQLALLECALVVSAVARRFELALPPGPPIRERFDFAMEPEGLRIEISARCA